jgi:hypothetical protein
VSGVATNRWRTRPGEYPGESSDHATVDISEFRAGRGSLQDGDLVTERDDFGFEQPTRFAADDHQLDDGDEQPVGDSARSGTQRGGRARSHERARLRPATLQGPARGGRSSFRHLQAGRPDRVSGASTVSNWSIERRPYV